MLWDKDIKKIQKLIADFTPSRVLATLVSMVVSPDKTVDSYLTSPSGESSTMIKDSYTDRRVEELDTNKIQMALRMFFTAIYRGLRVDYVLV